MDGKAPQIDSDASGGPGQRGAVADVLEGRSDWGLILGDCLDPVTGLASLPDGCADHVLSDPPYSERVHARLGTESRNDGTKVRSPLEFGCITAADAGALSAQAVRVSRRWALFFCDELAVDLWASSYESAGGDYVRTGVWVKLNPMPQMTGDRPGSGTESAVICHGPRVSGRMRWNGGGRDAVWHFNAKESGVDRVHKAQKPLALMEALVRDFTDPGDLILDPFAGSGTTGVACRRLGRRFLGWERDPKFHAAAIKRISAAREQLGLLAKVKAPKVEQGDMFKAGAK